MYLEEGREYDLKTDCWFFYNMVNLMLAIFEWSGTSLASMITGVLWSKVTVLLIFMFVLGVSGYCVVRKGGEEGSRKKFKGEEGGYIGGIMFRTVLFSIIVVDFSLRYFDLGGNVIILGFIYVFGLFVFVWSFYFMRIYSKAQYVKVFKGLLTISLVFVGGYSCYEGVLLFGGDGKIRKGLGLTFKGVEVVSVSEEWKCIDVAVIGDGWLIVLIFIVLFLFKGLFWMVLRKDRTYLFSCFDLGFYTLGAVLYFPSYVFGGACIGYALFLMYLYRRDEARFFMFSVLLGIIMVLISTGVFSPDSFIGYKIGFFWECYVWALFFFSEFFKVSYYFKAKTEKGKKRFVSRQLDQVISALVGMFISYLLYYLVITIFFTISGGTNADVEGGGLHKLVEDFVGYPKGTFYIIYFLSSEFGEPALSALEGAYRHFVSEKYGEMISDWAVFLFYYMLKLWFFSFCSFFKVLLVSFKYVIGGLTVYPFIFFTHIGGLLFPYLGWSCYLLVFILSVWYVEKVLKKVIILVFPLIVKKAVSMLFGASELERGGFDLFANSMKYIKLLFYLVLAWSLCYFDMCGVIINSVVGIYQVGFSQMVKTMSVNYDWSFFSVRDVVALIECIFMVIILVDFFRLCWKIYYKLEGAHEVERLFGGNFLLGVERLFCPFSFVISGLVWLVEFSFKNLGAEGLFIRSGCLYRSLEHFLVDRVLLGSVQDVLDLVCKVSYHIFMMMNHINMIIEFHFDNVSRAGFGDVWQRDRLRVEGLAVFTVFVVCTLGALGPEMSLSLLLAVLKAILVKRFALEAMYEARGGEEDKASAITMLGLTVSLVMAMALTVDLTAISIRSGFTLIESFSGLSESKMAAYKAGKVGGGGVVQAFRVMKMGVSSNDFDVSIFTTPKIFKD
uniref:hypothetical protein n=1 Tax=Sphaeromyxa zaharoni TaxID=275449 RepID=UPI0030026432